MPVAIAFDWQTPPSTLSGNLSSYEERLIAAVLALGDFFAAQMEAAMKAGASWTDRTGAARQGLRAFAVRAATSVVIHLVHSVFYGIFLEMGTRHMAPRAIIVPTMQRFHAPIMAALRQLVA